MNEKTRIALFIVLHVIGSMILFTLILALVIFSIRDWLRKYKGLDLAVFTRLQPLVNARNNRLMLGFTFLGKSQFLIPANLLLICFFLFVRHQHWYSIRALATALSSLVLMFLLKYLFHRRRPLYPLLNIAKGLSFPSGHAIMSVSFYGLLIYFILQTGWASPLQYLLITMLCLLILVIGFSRVYLRVHYASDVLVGFIVGLLWLLISLRIVQTAESLLV
ncbi:MAG: phosphatase PAP2 family protein [Chitinophagaceae bacterium]